MVMSSVVILPYKGGSSSVKKLSISLSEKLGKKVRRLLVENSRFIAKPRHIVINWGNNRFYANLESSAEYLNPSDNVRRATNKIRCFQVLSDSGVSVPEFTTSREEANAFFRDNGIVVCRTTVTGNSGQGIVLARTAEEVVPAPLYTRHVRHKDEYRVHVAFGKVIDYVQKKKRSGNENTNILVRSHNNGWVFCREGVTLPDVVKDQALAAVAALGLDFGAVDMGHRVGDNRAYVFEVNSAPGIEGTTVEKYTIAFLEKINEINAGRNQRTLTRRG
jgi:glutathione synthase/RimK-type ligase-like ATP-grasp enzyme